MEPWCYPPCYHGTWHHGTLLSWYHSTMVAWCPGTLVPWYHSTKVPWLHGTIVPWYHDTLIPGTSVAWHLATMVPRCRGTMVPWYQSTRAPWYHQATMVPGYESTMVPWHHGTMTPWYHEKGYTCELEKNLVCFCPHPPKRAWPVGVLTDKCFPQTGLACRGPHRCLGRRLWLASRLCPPRPPPLCGLTSGEVFSFGACVTRTYIHGKTPTT